jgi:hypothetical protein
MSPNPNQPETPRVEPEIIPPGAETRQRRRGRVEDFVFVDGQGRMHAARIKMPGPFAIGIGVAIFAVIAILVLSLAVSFALILVPVVVVAIAGALAYGYTRRWWNRVRGTGYPAPRR